MFRKSFTTVFLLFCVLTAAQAQIPVTDMAAISAQQQQHIASIAKYIDQIAQLKLQIDQQKALFDNLNGLRNVGGLMKDDLLTQNLPPQYQQAFNALRNGQGGSLAGISGSLNQIAGLYQSQNCNQHATPSAQRDCNAAWQTYSMNQYVGEKGYEQAFRNVQNLEQFVNSIQQAPDSKTMQDLQARIAVEQVRVQNEQVKLTTIQIMQKAQEDMRKKNAGDNTVRMLQGTGSIRF